MNGEPQEVRSYHVTLLLTERPGATPGIIRLRRALKALLRVYDIRATAITAAPPDPTPPPRKSCPKKVRAAAAP